MPQFSLESRHRHTTAYLHTDGRLTLLERLPFRYRDRDDNIWHVSAVTDSWWTLAERYYNHISDRAAGLWWVAFDYQTPALVDPTLRIRPNTMIVLPAASVVLGEILGASPTLYQ